MGSGSGSGPAEPTQHSIALSAAGQAAAAAPSTRRVCTSCVVRARVGARGGVQGAGRHSRQGPGLEMGAETTPEPSPSPTVLPAAPLRGEPGPRAWGATSPISPISPLSPLYLPYPGPRAWGAERDGAAWGVLLYAFCPGAFLSPVRFPPPFFMGGRAADKHGLGPLLCGPCELWAGGLGLGWTPPAGARTWRRRIAAAAAGRQAVHAW